MKFVVTVLFVLAGCAAPLVDREFADEQPLDEAVAQAALNAWVSEGLPVGRCQDDVAALMIVVRDDTAAACHGDPARPPLGCYAAAPQQVVVLGDASDQVTLVHELRHWLGECSGIGVDVEHVNQRMWFGDVL